MHILHSYVAGSRTVIIILNHIVFCNVVNLCDGLESLEFDLKTTFELLNIPVLISNGRHCKLYACPRLLMDLRDPATLGYNMETDDTRRPALKQAKIKLLSLQPTLLGWQIIIDAPRNSRES